MTETNDYVNKRHVFRMLRPYNEIYLDDATDVEFETMRLLWLRFSTLPTAGSKRRVLDWLVSRANEGENA